MRGWPLRFRYPTKAEATAHCPFEAGICIAAIYPAAATPFSFFPLPTLAPIRLMEKLPAQRRALQRKNRTLTLSAHIVRENFSLDFCRQDV